MRFNGICIISADVRRLAEFYIRILGVEGTVNSTFVGLATKGAALSIFSEEGMEDMASGSMQGEGRGGADPSGFGTRMEPSSTSMRRWHLRERPAEGWRLPKIPGVDGTPTHSYP